VIVASIVALCFEHLLGEKDCIAGGALALRVGDLVWCLWLYWRLIKPSVS